MSGSRRLAFVALLLVFSTVDAIAQDATPLMPAQTDSLQQALGLTDAKLLAPEAGRITVLGDGYVLRLPLDGGRRAAQFWGADYAMRARPLDGGRWAFDQLTLPPLFRVGPVGVEQDPAVRFRTTDATFAATVDPAHATASMSRFGFSAMSALVFHARGYAAEKALTIESGAGKIDGDGGASVAGRSDERSQVDLADIRITLPTEDPFHIFAGGLRIGWQIGGVDYAAVRSLAAGTDAVAQAITDPAPLPPAALDVPPAVVAPDAPPAVPDAAPASPAPASPVPAPPVPAPPVPAPPAPAPTSPTEPSGSDNGAPPPAVRSALKQLMPLLRATFTSSNMSAEADQLNVVAGDAPSVHVDRVRLSLIGAAPAGKLDIALGVTIEGLSAPDNRDFAGLIPRRVVFQPHLSGVSVDDLSTIANRLIDNPSFGAGNLSDAVTALLSHGPVRLAVDAWEIDVGPTRLHATGSVEAGSLHLREASGTADVTATKLDALMQRLSANRDMREMFQAMVFLKGLGRAEGDRTVWHVDFRGGKLLVNGQDFSEIIPVEP